MWRGSERINREDAVICQQGVVGERGNQHRGIAAKPIVIEVEIAGGGVVDHALGRRRGIDGPGAGAELGGGDAIQGEVVCPADVDHDAIRAFGEVGDRIDPGAAGGVAWTESDGTVWAAEWVEAAGAGERGRGRARGTR